MWLMAILLYLVVTAVPALALVSYFGDGVGGWFGLVLATLLLEAWLSGIYVVVMLTGRHDNGSEKRKAAERLRKQQELERRIRREIDEDPRNDAVRRKWDELYPGLRYPWDT